MGSLAREVCQREGAKAVLSGSIAPLGAHYAVALEAVSCRTGDALAREQVEAERKEEVLKALDQAASRLRGKLGESLGSIQAFDVPIEKATTSSLDALKAFSLGDAQRDRGAEVESIPFYERAIDLDPNFALAHATLGVVLANLGEEERASERLTQAFERRDRTSEREKLYISQHYYGTMTGELEKRRQALELWKQTYPRHVTPRINLALTYWRDLGQGDKALEESREALRIDPRLVFASTHHGASLLVLGRLDEARSVLEGAIRDKIDGLWLRWILYLTLIAQGDTAAMKTQEAWVKGRPGEYYLLSSAASFAASRGKLGEARKLFSQSIELARAAQLPEAAGGVAASWALTEAVLGQAGEARRRAGEALAAARSRATLPQSAVALALAGDTKAAESLVAELRRRYPADTLVNALWVPVVEAARDLDRGKPGEAVGHLTPTIPYELGYSAGCLPILLRGRAYLEAGRGAEATAEFQKILDHKGVAPGSPIHTLAYLGLAQAAGRAGDTARSRRGYQDFLAIFKDADPDLPLLRVAQREYQARR